MGKILSKAKSWDGWELLLFLKGRKKLLITVIGFGLGYVISDNAVIATVSAALVEMGFSLLEYYLKEYKQKI